MRERFKKESSRKENTQSENPPKILLAEDEMKDMAPLKMVLEEAGYQVDLAFDGLGVIDRLAETKYDLVVLDWSLPELSGNVAMMISQKNVLRPSSMGVTPVVAYSGAALQDLKLPEMPNFRLVDRWQKPMSLHELTKKVNSYFFDKVG